MRILTYSNVSNYHNHEQFFVRSRAGRMCAMIEHLPKRLYVPNGVEPTPAFVTGCTVARGLLYLAGGITVLGAENLPQEGPGIIASTHRSELESPILGAKLLAITGMQVKFLANEKFWETQLPDGSTTRRLAGDFCDLFDAQPIAPDKPMSMQTKAHIAKVFERGDILGLFPEARVLRGAKIGKLKNGVGFLASQYNVPIYPVAFGGFDYDMPGPLVMKCMPPILPPELPDDPRAARRCMPQVARGVMTELELALQSGLDRANAVSMRLPRTHRNRRLARVTQHFFPVPASSRLQAEN